MRVNASEFIPSVSWDATKQLGEDINGEGALEQAVFATYVH